MITEFESELKYILDLKEFDLREKLFLQNVDLKKLWNPAINTAGIVTIKLWESSSKDEFSDISLPNPSDDYWNDSEKVYYLYINDALENYIFSVMNREKLFYQTYMDKCNLRELGASFSESQIEEMLSNFNLPGKVSTLPPHKYNSLKSHYIIVNEQEYNTLIEPVINIYKVLDNYIKVSEGYSYLSKLFEFNTDKVFTSLVENEVNFPDTYQLIPEIKGDRIKHDLNLMKMLQSQEFKQMPKEWLIPKFHKIIENNKHTAKLSENSHLKMHINL